ncbi:MAG: amino acid ABC transporter substrate-binding protein [Actinobacteria bacterium]|nr:amino acid ABC transporter substrate-binding protein [Actinomycetota bacterium]
MRRSMRCSLVAAALGLVVAACGGGTTTAPVDTEPPRTTTIAPRISDGALRLGLLVPRSGPGATIGEPLVAIVEAAVRAINDNGGVNGSPIELFVEDEGGDSATALAAIDTLVTTHAVDAVVGPFSSSVALSTLPTLLAANVGVCSPAATTASLTNFPDRGMFVRTSPSDSLAALAMAQEVARTGIRSTVLAYPDDPFGRDYATDVRRALGLEGIAIVSEIQYDPGDDDYSEDVATLADGLVVTLIGDEESGARFLSTTLTTFSDTVVIVNDALARADLSSDPVMETDGRMSITGVAVDSAAGFSDLYATLQQAGLELPLAPLGPNDNPFAETRVAPVPLATASVDCVNLIALSALATKSDDALVFMDEAIPTSRGGSACLTFDECTALIASGLNIDYNGPTRLLALSPNGDPSIATFVTFGFGDDGKAEYRTEIGVVSAP